MKFYKFNGAGNDFIIINNIEEHIRAERFPAIAAKLCERHMSIGADGLMVVEQSRSADYRMVFYNSDGSVGEMCGNGSRCICRYGFEMGLAGETQTVETASGIILGRRIDKQRYRVRLTEPTVIKELGELHASDGRSYDCGYVELGDPGLPHAVVRMPGLRDIPPRQLYSLGRELRYNQAFRKGANVNFYDLEGTNHVFERTYERGVEDFTYACGTGTASVAIILAGRGQVSDEGFTADMQGGTLEIDIKRDNGAIRTVYLTGPTNMVCVGSVLDEEMEEMP